MEQNWQK